MRVALAVLALTSTALLAPATGADAAPATTHQGVVYAHDGKLFRAGPDLSNPTQIATTGPGLTYLQASADGSRVVYATDTAPASGSPHRTRVVVLNVGGRRVRVVADNTVEFNYRDGYGRLAQLPALSADGNVVLLGQRTYSGSKVSSRVVARDLLTGNPTLTDLIGYQQGALLPGGPYVGRVGWRLHSRSLDNPGSETEVPGLSSEVRDFALSPDGTHIAWEGDGRINVAAVEAPDHEYLSVGAPQVLDSGSVFAPRWSQDGSTVYYVRTVAVEGGTDSYLMSVPAAAGAPTQLSTAPDPGPTAIVGVRYDDVAPAPATAYGPLLGSVATIRWGLPADDDLAGVTVTRTAGGTSSPLGFVQAPVHSVLEDRDTKFGVDYGYSFTLEDRSGNDAATTSTHMEATDDAVGVPSITSFVTTGTPFPVYVQPNDHYRIWVADVGRTGFVPWSVEGAGRHDYGREGGTTAERGHTYAFRTQVFDSYGNASRPVTARAVVPLDDTDLAFTGDTRRIGDVHLWQRGATVMRPGSTLTVTVHGSSIAVLGNVCPTCGKVDVFRNGRLISSYDTFATYTQGSQLVTVLPRSKADVTYVLKPHPSGSHRDLVVDALSAQA